MNFLVIEDDPDVLEVVSLSLNMRWLFAHVKTATTGELGLEMVRREAPDVVILDIGLPGMDGFEVCSHIRAFSDVPIVMLTVRNSREDIIKGLELGADDYIVKPFNSEDLLARINAILRRIQMTHLRDEGMVFRQGNLAMDLRQGTVHANNETIRLSPTEYQVLYHLIANAGRVVASRVLMDKIWGEEYRERPYFLISGISRLKNTLQEHPQTRDLVLQEEEEGYMLTMVKGGLNRVLDS